MKMKAKTLVQRVASLHERDIGTLRTMDKLACQVDAELAGRVDRLENGAPLPGNFPQPWHAPRAEATFYLNHSYCSIAELRAELAVVPGSQEGLHIDVGVNHAFAAVLRNAARGTKYRVIIEEEAK